MGCQIGPDTDNMDVIPFRAVGDPMDTPTSLFTGDKIIDVFPGGWNEECYVALKQTQALPLTVVAIMPTIRTATLR